MNVPKTFEKAFSLASEDAQSARKYLADKRLSITEKKVLEGYLKLRQSDFDWIKEQLLPLHSSLPFVEGVRNLILGIAMNNSGKPHEAILWIEKSRSLLQDCASAETRFLCTYNLFVAYHNLSDLDRLEELRDEIIKFQFAEKSALKIRQLRIQFSFWVLKKNESKVFKLLEELNEIQTSMDDFQRLAWSIDKIRFYSGIKDYDQCYSELEKLKECRSFYLSADYKFIKATLGFLQKGKPLYLYIQEFSSIPILAHQVEVLLALESRDMRHAESSWEKLKQISPKVYCEDFQYRGESCLFSLALEKFLQSFQEKKIPPVKSVVTKEERLYDLLVLYPMGIGKNELYQLIWGTAPVTKSDLGKLSKLLERVKLKHGIEVQSRKGVYILHSTSKQKDSA
jgi:hypothetical protein